MRLGLYFVHLITLLIYLTLESFELSHCTCLVLYHRVLADDRDILALYSLIGEHGQILFSFTVRANMATRWHCCRCIVLLETTEELLIRQRMLW